MNRFSGLAPKTGSNPFPATASRAGSEISIPMRRSDRRPRKSSVIKATIFLISPRVQGLEHHDVVDAVDELGTEVPLHLPHNHFLHRLRDFAASRRPLHQVTGADVRGHDDHRVPEIDGTPLRIGQAAVVEHLQQGVEDVVVGLLDLVEQDHGIRLPPDRLGQLTPVLVSDVTGRRPDQTGHGVLLHVLGHVDADHVLLAVEQRLGQGPGQLGLSDPGRPKENERPDGAFGVLDPGAGAKDRIGDEPNRLVLPDDAPVQDFIEAQQLLALPLHQAGDGNPRPPRHDLGDLGFGHLLAQQSALGAVAVAVFGLFQAALEIGKAAVLELRRLVEVLAALRFLDTAASLFDLLLQLAHLPDGAFLLFPLIAHCPGLRLQIGQLRPQRLQPFPAGAVLFFEQGSFLDLQLRRAPHRLVDLGRHRIDLRAYKGAGLVDEVDRLVGQEAVADVPVREHRGGDQGVVLNPDPVMGLRTVP